jgi:hypothetical protein
MLVAEAEEDDTGRCTPGTENRFAELLVVRDEDALVAEGAPQNLAVVGLLHDLGHGKHVVACLAEILNTAWPADSSTISRMMGLRH